jgi:hypothetical protein
MRGYCSPQTKDFFKVKKTIFYLKQAYKEIFGYKAPSHVLFI